jgi:APA family basic amino acid/polyamine antiporter
MSELKKVLGFPAILLITISAIMGTGIYFLPSVSAGLAGPASIISWVIMSVIAIYIGMCFAELSSMFPKAGGIYEYCKHAYGKFISFIVGWTALITGNITIAMLVVGAIQYLLPYDINLPKILISIIFILIFNFIAYRGMRTSAFMLMTFAGLSLTVIFSLIVPGFFKMSLANFSPFFVFPLSAVFIAVFFIAETFFGWESVTFLAEETKNPEKTMPKALIYGTITIAVIALLFVITSIGSVGWQAFGNFNTPLANISQVYFGPVGFYIFTLSVYLSIIGAVAAWIVAAPRLIYSLSRDKLFIAQFAKVHLKYHTPYKAIILQTAISILLILSLGGVYRELLVMLVPLAVIVYSLVLFALVILRYKEPNRTRAYKAPFGKFGPLLVILFNIILIRTWIVMESDAVRSLKFGFSLIGAGIPFYLLFEMYYNPKAIRFADDILAYITLLTERVALPLSARKQIISLLGNIKGKTLLEFGCSVGTLTRHLAEEVGPKGMIYATDISKRQLKIAEGRLKKHHHVILIHDEHHHRRVHPAVPEIHTIVSISALSYIKEVKSVLRDMNKRLKRGSKICFLEYDKFFDLIPNVEWLGDDKKIKRVFHDSGFTVGIIRKQGFAWRYTYIYGVKFRDVKGPMIKSKK